MDSLAFPDIFTSTKVKVIHDNEATSSNLRLVLLSDKNQLFGDPEFGSNLHRLIYQQNDAVIMDIAIDYVYSCITTFMPQLYLKRRDIYIEQNGVNMNIKFRATNMLNNTSNLYEIALMEDAEY